MMREMFNVSAAGVRQRLSRTQRNDEGSFGATPWRSTVRTRGAKNRMVAMLIAMEQATATKTAYRTDNSGQAAHRAGRRVATANMLAGTQKFLRLAPPCTGHTISGLAGQAESSTACSYQAAPVRSAVARRATSSKVSLISRSNIGRS